jgi:myxalamid-type polyketide synthase MxaB
VYYHLVYLAETSLQEPDLVGSILRQITNWIEKGELPTLPKTTFASDRVTDAFRYMMQAKHIGKIVVVRGDQLRGDTSKAATVSGDNGLVIRSDGTYLVTGGLGGIGLKTSSWLAANGAKHLVLMGRTAGFLGAASNLQELQQFGTIVRMVQGDVTKEADVNRVMDMIRNEMPPLKGIIHSAGVLEDGALVRQTWPRFAAVLAPKVVGAWNLHRLTAGCSLDFFVLFSSIAALLGSRGQGNHAAANAFLDGLAHLRKMQGLPALSINWGAWTEIGAAARHNVESRIRLQGVDSFSPGEGLIILDKLLSSNLTQVGVMPVNWHVFLRQYPRGKGTAYYSAFHLEAGGLSSPSIPGEGKRPASAVFMDELEKAPDHKWEQLIRNHIRKLAVKVLALSEEDEIEDDRPLHELGMDSLMAVELRNLLKSSLRLEKALAATLVFDYPTISELAGFIYNRLAESKGMISEKSEAGKTSVCQEGSTTLDEVEQLSDDEVDRLLADRTKQWS